MFYFFYMDFNYRDFLCFLWFENNKFGKLIKEYWMNIYFFGNGFSLVIVMFRFGKIVVDGKEEFGEDVMKFV